MNLTSLVSRTSALFFRSQCGGMPILGEEVYTNDSSKNVFTPTLVRPTACEQLSIISIPSLPSALPSKYLAIRYLKASVEKLNTIN